MVSLIEENRITLQEIVDQIRVRFKLLYFEIYHSHYEVYYFHFEVYYSILKFTIRILKFTIPF